MNKEIIIETLANMSNDGQKRFFELVQIPEEEKNILREQVFLYKCQHDEKFYKKVVYELGNKLYNEVNK